MKNRYIPFGYQIQNGDSVINTEQAATVQHIFYAYTEGQSFKEIAEYLTTSGTAYHFSDNSWNKNIVARILANEIYCGAKGYPAIISKEVYSQAASIRSNKTVTYSAVLKPFRSDMQCACCGERLYWRPEPNNGLADSAECGQSRCNLKTWHNKSWIGYTKSNSTRK